MKLLYLCNNIHMRNRVKFKDYNQNQGVLFPVSLEDLIAQSHPVRVVNEVIDKINLSKLESEYSVIGSSSYHPRMLLKVLVFGYLNNTYSSRRIEASIKENIHFMWLAGMSRPDHNTINRFRGVRLENTLKEIFTQVVKLLVDSGHVSLQEVYIDGTKIEANANRYTFVWGRAIKSNKEKMKEQLKALWEYAQQVTKSENEVPEPPDFEPTDPEKILEVINQINEKLVGAEVDKKVKTKLKYARDNWPGNIAKYQQYEKILKERNSFSKTDTDATFMRMKEDHMLNGQLKPAYNIQISTENQIITHFTTHQNPTDTKTLIPHLESFNEQYNQLPAVAVADAGYGSEQNYEYLQDHQIQAFVKYNAFDKEQKKPGKKAKQFTTDRLFYDSKKDQFICPMGQPIVHQRTYTQKSEAGYQRTIDRYEAQNCKNCPIKGVCHSAKGNRVIEISKRGIELRKQANELLKSEQGIYYRKKRCIEPEPVFANIKHNSKFKRFGLRGLDKVTLEFGLIALAHNLKKIAI
jgi:transposase